MHVRTRARVPDVRPADALAWWSDFQEGTHDHRFFPVSKRTIEAQSPGGTAMVDKSGFYVERTTAHVEGNVVVFAGVNNLARFEGRYAFSAESSDPIEGSAQQGGAAERGAADRGAASVGQATAGSARIPEGATIIEAEATITPRGPLRWVSLLGKPIVWAFVAWDLRMHAREMARDLRRGGPIGESRAGSRSG
ncbi:MAG: hypothetical protein ACYDDF_06410 [Thermoplasmatota archaeon]